MPSLICLWEGRCLDPQTRAELIAYLLELAQCSRRRWEGPEIPRPDFLVIPREHAERRARETELVRAFEGPITGSIVIEPKLATYEALQTDRSAPAQPIEGPSDWSVHEGETSCLAYSATQERWLAFVPPAIELNGVDFRLYDPRALYPDEDRVSFLFVNCPQWPALHGKIVAAESHVQCQSYEVELIQAANWLLARPSIHLRYYLEDWFDLLLAWIKRFFIDDLWYWRGEDCSQYEALKQKIDELVETAGEVGARKTFFLEILLPRFQEEADRWGERVVRMALEGISLEAVEAERAEVEGVAADSGIRCGTCGPQGSPSEHDAGQELSIRELYEQLHSQRYGEAVDAVKGLVAAGPEYFVLVLRALKEPQLEHLRSHFLIELSNIDDQALPLAKTVVKYLDASTMPAEVTTSAAYAMSKMGKEADSSIHAWMEETPAAAWNSWPSTLFHFIGEDRSVEFLRAALTSGNGERKLWACQTIVSEITHPWDALIPTLVDLLPGADEWQRTAAIDALVSIGQSAVETMWAMSEARRADVRAAGLEALGRYATYDRYAAPAQQFVRRIDGDGRDVFAQLSAKLADPEPEVRVSAAVALQKVAVAVSNELLRAELETANRDMQIAVAKGHQDCVVNRHGLEALRHAIRSRIAEPGKHPFANRRIAAVDLATSSDAHADESSPVLAGLCDWHDPWRREYLEAIRVAGVRAKALMPGILCCTAADPSLQVPALEILGALGEHAPDDAVDRAIECLASSHQEVREAAANALGDFGPTKRAAAFALTKALADRSSGICGAACIALGKMKKLAADAVPEIAAAVGRVGDTAVQALGRIGTTEARAAVTLIYQRMSGRDDEENLLVREEARTWLQKWEMLPPASDDSLELDREGADRSL